MKIVFCQNHFLPNQVAGTEIYTFELAKLLKAKGHEILIVIPHFGKDKELKYEVDNIDVFCYPEPQVVERSFIQNRMAPKGLSAFIRVLAQFAPDIVHFQEVTASNGISLFHLIAARERGYKTLITFHLAGYSCNTGNLMYENKRLCDGLISTKKCAWCSYTNKQMPAVNRLLLYGTSSILNFIGYDTRQWQSKIGTALSFPFLIKNLKESFNELIGACDHIVSITNWYRDILIKNGVEPAKISYIPQGLRNQSFKRNLQTKNDGIIKLVFIGRITPIKGLHWLIEALKDFSGFNISLTIYGKCIEEDYYIQCRKISEGMENIIWKGNLPKDDVMQTLINFDVLCLPSGFSEMSPLVIQEAFAAGLPVLASNVYGNAEQIKDDENGWLFHFQNVRDLQRCLRVLVSNPEKIMKAKKKLPAVRSFHEVAIEYDVLYTKILAER